MNKAIQAVQLTTVCVALMLSSACAKPPVKNAQLDRARASLESVNADSDVRRYSSCLLYTSPSPRDLSTSRMPSSA